MRLFQITCTGGEFSKYSRVVERRDGNPLLRNRNSHDDLPDVRDDLTHRERIVLWCLSELQQERVDRNVPTGMLYGSVVKYVDMIVDEMPSLLIRLVEHES